jgi:hypothetical protein
MTVESTWWFSYTITFAYAWQLDWSRVYVFLFKMAAQLFTQRPRKCCNTRPMKAQERVPAILSPATYTLSLTHPAVRSTSSGFRNIPIACLQII